MRVGALKGSDLWGEEASEPSSGCSVKSRPTSQTSTDTLTSLDLPQATLQHHNPHHLPSSSSSSSSYQPYPLPAHLPPQPYLSQPSQLPPPAHCLPPAPFPLPHNRINPSHHSQPLSYHPHPSHQPEIKSLDYLTEVVAHPSLHRHQRPVLSPSSEGTSYQHRLPGRIPPTQSAASQVVHHHGPYPSTSSHSPGLGSFSSSSTFGAFQESSPHAATGIIPVRSPTALQFSLYPQQRRSPSSSSLQSQYCLPTRHPRHSHHQSRSSLEPSHKAAKVHNNPLCPPYPKTYLEVSSSSSCSSSKLAETTHSSATSLANSSLPFSVHLPESTAIINNNVVEYSSQVPSVRCPWSPVPSSHPFEFQSISSYVPVHRSSSSQFFQELAETTSTIPHYHQPRPPPSDLIGAPAKFTPTLLQPQQAQLEQQSLQAQLEQQSLQVSLGELCENLPSFPTPCVKDLSISSSYFSSNNHLTQGCQTLPTSNVPVSVVASDEHCVSPVPLRAAPLTLDSRSSDHLIHCSLLTGSGSSCSCNPVISSSICTDREVRTVSSSSKRLVILHRRSANYSGSSFSSTSKICGLQRTSSTATMSNQQDELAPTRRMRSLRSHHYRPSHSGASASGSSNTGATNNRSSPDGVQINFSSPSRERSESPTEQGRSSNHLRHTHHHHHRHHHNLRGTGGTASNPSAAASSKPTDAANVDQFAVSPQFGNDDHECNLASDCEDCDDCDDVGACSIGCDECDLIEQHSSEEELETLTGSWQRENNGPPEKRKWSQVARLSLTDSGSSDDETYDQKDRTPVQFRATPPLEVHKPLRTVSPPSKMLGLGSPPSTSRHPSSPASTLTGDSSQANESGCSRSTGGVDPSHTDIRNSSDPVTSGGGGVLILDNSRLLLHQQGGLGASLLVAGAREGDRGGNKSEGDMGVAGRAASPRKRHRHTGRHHNRPSLDFEKMQQIKNNAVTQWRNSGELSLSFC